MGRKGRDFNMNMIEFWRKQKLDASPFIAECDKNILNHSNVKITKNYKQFLTETDNWGGTKNIMDVGLYPVPYTGNLRKAEIFILLLNPGLSFGDYFAEFNQPNFIHIRRDNLYQDLDEYTHPFIWLNPEFSWHPGFRWWYRKFEKILQRMMEANNIDSLKALQVLSNKIAAIELFPYHSKNGVSSQLKGQIESSNRARKYVHDVLIPKANKDRALVIVTRSSKEWNIKSGKHVIVYDRHQARGASLGLRTRGGKAICRFLGI